MSSSFDVVALCVSTDTVKMAVPPEGSPWCSVSTLQPQRAKTLSRPLTTPGSSRSVNDRLTTRPCDFSWKVKTTSLYL